MPTRRQALMRAYVPSQAYAQDYDQISSQVKSEVERSDALAKLASDARDQLARTQEATRVRIETGTPLTPVDVEFLRQYTAKGAAVGRGLPAIPKNIQDNLTNNLNSGILTIDAWKKFVGEVAKIGSPVQRAAALQAGYLVKNNKGEPIGSLVGLTELGNALGKTGLSTVGYTIDQVKPGSPSIKATSTGISDTEQKKADALASALQEASPSGFAGGPEARAWRESLAPEEEALLSQYVSALSDPTSTADALAQIPADQLAFAKQLYQEATNRGGFQKQQAQLFSPAMQTAIRAAQEAEARASAVQINYQSPAAEARKRALAAQGVTNSTTALRALFQGTGLENKVGRIMERTKDPLGHEPKDDFEEAIRRAWAAGVRPEDLDQVLSSRNGIDLPGSSSWSDAVKGFKTRWKTPTDQREAAQAYYTGLGVQDAIEKARKIQPTKAEEYARTKKDTEEQAAQIESVRNAPLGPNETASVQRSNMDRAAANAFREDTRREAVRAYRALLASGMDEVEAQAEIRKRNMILPAQGRIMTDRITITEAPPVAPVSVSSAPVAPVSVSSAPVAPVSVSSAPVASKPKAPPVVSSTTTMPASLPLSQQIWARDYMSVKDDPAKLAALNATVAALKAKGN